MSSLPVQILRLTVLVAAAMAVTACAGITCERPERYAGAGSVPPLQVPEDLSEPDQSRALRIPARPVEEPRRIGRRGPCLESPPHFFDRPLLED